MDSSVLIALERQGAPLSVLSERAPEEQLFLCSVIAAELLVGVEYADIPERRIERTRFVERLLSTLPVLPFDLAAARVHAVVAATLHKAGQATGAHDLLIAATAIANGLGILTANPDHFRRIPGLRVAEFSL